MKTLKPNHKEPTIFIEVGAVVEALDIANGETDDEIGIWIPTSREHQEALDGQICNIRIDIIDEA